MTRYELYKKASYDWLKNIPFHWEELFLEQVAQEKLKKNSNNDISKVLSLSYGSIKVKKDLNKGLISKDLSTYQIVEPGDIIMRLTDLQNDHKSLRTGLVNDKGIITAAYLCLSPKINSRYLHYLLHSYDTLKVFYGMGGGVRQSIGFKDIRHMYLPVPPRTEQEQIVRFLDWKVSEINKLIGIERGKLEFLAEMIHSKFQDIILGSKEKITLKRLVSLENEFVKIESDNFYQKAGMYNRGRGIFLREPVLGKDMGASKFQRIHKDRLMISGQFAWEDAIYVTTKKDEVGLASHRYYLLKSINSNVPVEYLFGYFFSMKGLSELQRCSHGAAGRNRPLNINELLRIKIPVINDRDLIISFCKIVRAYMEMRPIVLSKEKLLSELKNRIISDVVTGKIDVRNVEIPEYEHIDDMVDDGDWEENEEELADAEETEL